MADEKPKTLLDTYRPALAEFFAMTLFVWCGCGTAVSVQAMPVFNPNRPMDTSLLLSISVAFGFAIAVLVYTIAPISGGHINPAVTFAFVMSGKMPILDGLRYIIAQCLGAFLGASIIWGAAASDLLTMSTSYIMIEIHNCVVLVTKNFLTHIFARIYHTTNRYRSSIQYWYEFCHIINSCSICLFG